MDYQSIHGQDIASFDLPSTHRLPTVSAADALEELGTDPKRFFSTGLDELDRLLAPEVEDASSQDAVRPGGFQRGQVVEIWGPPGIGKTTFGLQLASDALRKGGKAVWVDGYRPVSGKRLSQILDTSTSTEGPAIESGASSEPHFSDLTHITCPTLAHFVALLCRPTASCVADGTSLIIVDSFSALVNQAFPKTQEPRNTPKGVPSTSTRRLQILQSVISSLQKLAATRDITIVILSHCATRIQAERGAALIPAINATAWEQGISTRLVLFRDWSFQKEHITGVRCVGIQKLNGKASADSIGPVLAFSVHEKGLVSVEHDATQASAILSSTAQPKRKLGSTDFEVADSEDEYGWDDEDSNELPPNPSQWQGSEDILLGNHDEDGNRRDDYSDEGSIQDGESELES
ncbi:P-loop containing nucleoside triphosphate hydrolase protein [Pestalotiopsis sp. NC0098]|nr:P-loop containing nucleoside triphosphate hydrolase protein [Pestalotiopsis sp. NC0098]